MQEFKKLAGKIVLLVLDLLILLLNVLQQTRLPGKGKRSNIFSCALLLYTESLLRIDTFEHGHFRMPLLLRHKWVRFGLLFIAAFLLALASFEPPSTHCLETVIKTEQTGVSASTFEVNQIWAQPAPSRQPISYKDQKALYPSLSEHPILARYLWVRCLRI